MRLVCPNCDAEYEVPDEVIPPEGRDVQCSNCGHTWFEGPVGAAGEDVPVEEEAAAAPVAGGPEPGAPEPDRVDGPTVPERNSSGSGRQLDPEVASILREEAEREEAARRAERLESQPDLGLESASAPAPELDPEERRAEEARMNLARMRGDVAETTAPEVATEAAITAAAVGSRRDLLPDVEEINSTLRASGETRASSAESDAAPAPSRKSGGARGFWLVLILAALATALYVFAPQIAAQVPALEPALTAYVSAVNGARDWLAQSLSGMLTWLDTMASQASEARDAASG